jgi:two-component system, OmpR family, sensor kinase
MIFRSMRWRLQIWYGLVFLAVLAGFGLTAYELERNRELRNIDVEFQRRMGALSSAMRPPQGPRGPGMDRGGGPGDDFFDGGPPDGQRGDRGGRGGRGEGFRGEGRPEDRGRPLDGQGFQIHLPPDVTNLFGMESNSFYYVMWGHEGEELARSEATPRDMPKPTDAGPGAPPPPRMRGMLREIFHATPGGGMVLVGRSIAPELAGLRVVAWSLAGAGAVVLLLGLTGGWWIATQALRPVEEISATAVKIAAGDLSQRISTEETDSELGRLATVLNSTFARLETAFAQQREFTADAAHELRTPLAVMLTQTQMTLNRERGAAEYRATVEACQRAAQRMRQLMESLLQLARLDAGQEAMKRMPFDLGKVAADCAELLTPLAEERQVKIECAVPSISCVGDAERMGQVLTNLLSNAIEYNKPSGEVRVGAEVAEGVVKLTVADTGAGIAAEDLPRVFERFYRADKARSGSGHTGLGLAISRAIVQAHGGAMEVASEVGVGTTFTVTLPMAGDKAAPARASDDVP